MGKGLRVNAATIAMLRKTERGRQFLERAGITDEPRRQKYKNQKVYLVIDPALHGGYHRVDSMEGIRQARKRGLQAVVLDSLLEFDHWCKFRQMLDAGVITRYERQKTFVLVPAFAHPQTGRMQRRITYVADHYFEFADGRKGICDSKGRRTRVYIDKAKQYIRLYGAETPLYEWTAEGMTLADFAQVKTSRLTVAKPARPVPKAAATAPNKKAARRKTQG